MHQKLEDERLATMSKELATKTTREKGNMQGQRCARRPATTRERVREKMLEKEGGRDARTRGQEER